MKKVFVIDDDDVYQGYMQVHLRTFGYEVHSFLNGESCLARLDEKPSLIILDQNLGEETSGLDYLRKIKQKVPKIPVLFMSAQNDLSSAVEAVKCGASDYIEKNSAAFVRLRTALENIENRKKGNRSFNILKTINMVLGIALAVLFILLFMYW